MVSNSSTQGIYFGMNKNIKMIGCFNYTNGWMLISFQEKDKYYTDI